MSDDLDPDLLREAVLDARSWDAVLDALRTTEYLTSAEDERVDFNARRDALLSVLTAIDRLATVDPAVGEALDKLRVSVQIVFSIDERWRSTHHTRHDAYQDMRVALDALRNRVETSHFRPHTT